MEKYIIVGIIALLIVYVLVIYNQLVTLRNLVKEAFSTMDVYLKKRWDLIPNLVDTVKKYSEYEAETLEHVTELRSKNYESMNENDKIDTNKELGYGISKIVAVAEKYPDLKASKNFTDLTEQLAKVEDEIANARKYYNGTVRKINNTIETFPSNIVALIFCFKSFKMFEIENEERENVSVKF